MICIFDSETVPDIDLIRANLDVEGLDDFQATLKAQEIFAKERGGSTFLPIPYHKVVAISAVIADNNRKFKKVGDFGNGSRDEREIIAHFFEFIESKRPQLVSFNGRGFDIPMLLVRAMKYNLSFPIWFDSSNKWENYRQRYSESFHLDLMDTLSGFGAVRGLNLDLLCSMAGVTGKHDVEGSMVMELFYTGEIEKIREYCQSDVLNTYWIFLKYELLRGALSISDYYSYLAIMKSSLEKERGYYQAFCEHIDIELSKSSEKVEEPKESL